MGATANAVKMAPSQPVSNCEAVKLEATKYTGWDPSIIAAISEAESLYEGVSCNVKAKGDNHLTYQQNGRTYGYSVSVMQVRILPGREDCDKYDLVVSIKCAHDIYISQRAITGNGYTAWTQYNNGEYLRYL